MVVVMALGARADAPLYEIAFQSGKQVCARFENARRSTVLASSIG
jgi:hypothetical protein